MQQSHVSGVGGARPLALMALLLTAGACSDVVGPGPLPQGVTASFGEVSDGGGETVTVCKVVTSGALGPYSFSVAQAGGRTGSLPQGETFALAHGECLVVWRAAAAPPDSDPLVTVTVGEVNLPTDMQLDSVTVASVIAEDPSTFAGPDAWARVNFYHGATITFYNSEAPPTLCDGLTPGYWKNWRNHYTDAQFTTLLSGTIASSIAEADAILNGSSSKDAIVQLRMFVLANQLTLNLTGTELPNPDDAGLAGDCTAWSGSATLGSTLDLGLAMLANPSAYTRGQILAAKDVLDAIANLGGD
jgi:hypothetical protein